MPTRNPPTIAFISLGCAKNLVDSEKMLGQLVESGALITADESEAEIIVINTCGFIEAARREAHEAIAGAIKLKRSGRCQRVVVAGCLVQREGEKLLEDLPGIDALVSVHRRDDVVRAALLSRPRKATKRKPPHDRPDLYLSRYYPHIALDTVRLRLTPRHYAYLRINEGCNQKCTFCTIPAIRGPLRSKPPEIVLAEARELISDGAKELVLIGQDTTSYGLDIDGKQGLAELLPKLDQLEGVEWLRLLYAYPSIFDDRTIEAIANCQKVVKYVDLPLQHINDRILKTMNRRVTRAQTESLLRKLRERIPDVAIRTTLIAGFPGETEAEFEELLAFVEDFKFSALGVFCYSNEPDTPASRLGDQLPEKEKQARSDALMQSQQKIAFEHAASQIGKYFEVLIDGKTTDGLFVGRHAGQAPEVDSVTLVQAPQVEIGQFISVKCEGSKGYDLLARPADQDNKR